MLKSLFNKLYSDLQAFIQAYMPATLLKETPLKFSKFLRTPILKNICKRLPLPMFPLILLKTSRKQKNSNVSREDDLYIKTEVLALLHVTI